MPETTTAALPIRLSTFGFHATRRIVDLVVLAEMRILTINDSGLFIDARYAGQILVAHVKPLQIRLCRLRAVVLRSSRTAP
jgi:hypothetical protein